MLGLMSCSRLRVNNPLLLLCSLPSLSLVLSLSPPLRCSIPPPLLLFNLFFLFLSLLPWHPVQSSGRGVMMLVVGCGALLTDAHPAVVISMCAAAHMRLTAFQRTFFVT